MTINCYKQIKVNQINVIKTVIVDKLIQAPDNLQDRLPKSLTISEISYLLCKKCDVEEAQTLNFSC